MATLETDVQNRYSTQFLANASNPQNTGATTLDSARLSNAVTDVQADFQLECGVAYDSTVAIHVAVCVPAVIAKLLVYTGQADQTLYDQAVERMRQARLVLGRDRISPSTDSLLSPTADTSGSLPDFDRQVFKNYVPNSPSRPKTQDSARQ